MHNYTQSRCVYELPMPRTHLDDDLDLGTVQTGHLALERRHRERELLPAVKLSADAEHWSEKAGRF